VWAEVLRYGQGRRDTSGVQSRARVASARGLIGRTLSAIVAACATGRQNTTGRLVTAGKYT